jgi:uncharacterized membrane protein YphA (DoxX/SURF4 family)
MVSRGFSVFLAFLRVAAGLSLIGPGLHKLGWFTHPTLEPKLAAWAAHTPSALVAKYLAIVTPHHSVLARLVVVGELGLGSLLVLGLLTPLAALLAFVMVLNFHFASGQTFVVDYVFGQSGLVYLLVFPVLSLGRAGTSLGLDGVLGRSGQQARPGP